MKAEAVKTHEDSCNYKNVKCPSLLCNDMVPIDSVRMHVNTTHDGVIVEHVHKTKVVVYSIRCDTPSSFWSPCITSFDYHTFFLCAKVEQNTWWAWVVIVGDETMAEKYEVKISISGWDAWMGIRGKVHSIFANQKVVAEESEGVLKFPMYQASKLGKLEGVELKVDIKHEILRK